MNFGTLGDWRVRASGHGDGVIDLKFAIPTVIKNTKSCVATLLNFSEHKPSADCMDGAGRNGKAVASRNRPQATRSAIEPSRIASRNCRKVRCTFRPSAILASGSALENVPGFGFAVSLSIDFA